MEKRLENSSSSNKTQPSNIPRQNDSFLPNKQLKKTIFPIFILFIIVIFTLILTCSITAIIFYVLCEFRIISIINPSKIYAPGDKSLYNLHHFTYRNGSLSRFNSRVVISDEEDVYRRTYVVSDDRNNEYYYYGNGNEIMSFPDDSTSYEYIEVYPFTEDLHTVRCSGTCNCYDVSESQERRLANLVYSHRYVSTFGIVVLAWAAAKFVNDHMDECYRDARSLLGHDAPIVCAVEAMAEKKEKKDDASDELKIHSWGVDCEDALKKHFAKNGPYYFCEGTCQSAEKNVKRHKKGPPKDPGDFHWEVIQKMVRELVNRCEEESMSSYVVLAENMEQAYLEYSLILHNYCTQQLQVKRGEWLEDLNKQFLEFGEKFYCTGGEMRCDGPENDYAFRH